MSGKTNSQEGTSERDVEVSLTTKSDEVVSAGVAMKRFFSLDG